MITIDVGIERGKTMVIRKSNSALLEMEIMDFFHCDNLPDRAVESNCLYKILGVAKVVGSGFTIPSRKEIGGELHFSWNCFKIYFYKNISFIHS